MMLSIVNYLKENGITADIRIGSVVDGDGIGLFSTSGLSPTFYMDDTIVKYEGLQIISRNTSYSKGLEILDSIFYLLNKLEGYKPQQSPFYIGRDSNNRAEFSVNYIITKDGEW